MLLSAGALNHASVFCCGNANGRAHDAGQLVHETFSLAKGQVKDLAHQNGGLYGVLRIQLRSPACTCFGRVPLGNRLLRNFEGGRGRIWRHCRFAINQKLAKRNGNRFTDR
jgi:hypothetical protein